MSLISVIIPVYKVEEYLERCVSSVVGQTYSDLEIILVDDGSPDNCPMMCDEWAVKDSRIKVIHKQNGGLSDARNAGLDIARGDWIAFVDSDDWIQSNFYETLMNAANKYQAQIVASGVMKINDTEQIFVGRQYEQNLFNSNEALRTIIEGDGFHAVAWNKIYRRELFVGIKYPVNKLHEDEFITYRLIDRADTMVLCQNAIYYYWQRTGSIMSTWSERHLDALEAWVARLQLLQMKYPDIYIDDYAGFCVGCLNYYREILSHYKNKELLKTIRMWRKKPHFSLQQWMQLNIKQKIYVIISADCIGVFAKILNFRKGK